MRSKLVLAALVAASAWVAVAARQAPHGAAAAPASAAAPAPAQPPVERPEVPPPPFTEGIYPCSQCHNKEMPPNRTRRKLEVHDDIVLKHDEKNRWCLDCHSAENRDVLHLASGEFVQFDESYRLCGQCHGEKYRDWRAGGHGRRIGEWNGHKRYLLCVNCHNPHQPHFKPLQPKPAPVPPSHPGRQGF
jgi:hypothetical protein